MHAPEHAAERVRELPALWPAGPIDEVIRTTAPDVFADPRRNPPPDQRARLRRFRFLDDGEDRAFTDLFESVIHAAR